MIIYFNDTFLEQDFVDFSINQFNSSISKFLDFSAVISAKRIKYSHHRIYFKADEKIKAFFNELGEKHYLLFLTAMDKLNIKYWNGNSCLDVNCSYYFYDTSVDPPIAENISNSSLAELAEIKKKGEPYVLGVNLPDLRFSKIQLIFVTIILKADRSNSDTYKIDCADCLNSLSSWIDRSLSEKYMYTNFERPPLDEETCLINESKFSRIPGKVEKGRQVYKDNSSDYYWYVDNFHKGEGAEIEVFNNQGKHLGVADLDGNIDYSKEVKGRTINIS